MASDFPAHVTQNIDKSECLEYPVSSVAGEVAQKAGELMVFDTTDTRLERCGADPALIAGIFEGTSENWRTLTPNGYVPIRALSSDTIVKMCSSTTPALAHIGVLYGVVRLASGHWAVDISDTSNTRVLVVGISTNPEYFLVKFVAANLQFDAVAS